MQRVLLIASSTLFSRGLERLLQQEPSLDFLGCEHDLGRAGGRIEALRPDVVIVVKGEMADDLGDTLRAASQRGGQIQVVEVDPEDNAVSIYSGRREVIGRMQDLVTAIECSTLSCLPQESPPTEGALC